MDRNPGNPAHNITGRICGSFSELSEQRLSAPGSLNTVSQIRSLVTSLRSSDTSLAQDTILVGGASASTLDFANDTTNQFNTMRILTVGAIFLVLLVVLGSYPLAITGILSIGLSIVWGVRSNASVLQQCPPIRRPLHHTPHPLSSRLWNRHGLQHLHSNKDQGRSSEGQRDQGSCG